MKIFYDEACLTYGSPGHPERPERVSRTVALLKKQQDVALQWSLPPALDEAAVRRVHTDAHLRGLHRDYSFDSDTPAYHGIAARAQASVAAALGALDTALAGEAAFSLMRPPGHHARPEQAMGFCYLNQIAIAACAAVDRDRRVAVFDFDVHHGNGTQDILHGKENTAFFSIHQSPGYPGTGRTSHLNCHNYPMPPGTPRQDYVAAFRRAFDVMLAQKPDLIAVSAGFDAFRGDPLADENVEHEDYFDLGRALRDSGIPCFALLEGGYSDDLPELVLAFLKGLAPDA